MITRKISVCCILVMGDRFEGSFKDDMVQGQGTYIFANRQRFTGEWWSNRLV